MFLKKNIPTLELKYEALISEIEDVVVRQYSQRGVKLIKQETKNGNIKLLFNVGCKEYLRMEISKK